MDRYTYKTTVLEVLKSIGEEIVRVESEEKEVVKTESDLAKAEEARNTLRKVLKIKSQIQAQKVARIGQALAEAEVKWNRGQAALTEEERARELTWTDYGTTSEFKEAVGMAGRTASDYKKFYENYEKIKQYWFARTKEIRFTAPPGSWRKYMDTALKPNKSKRAAPTNNNKNTRSSRKRKRSDEEEKEDDTSEDEYQPPKKKAKRTRSKSNKNSNRNKSTAKKTITFPHPNHQSATEYEQVENQTALFSWLHYDSKGKHKSDVHESCSKCNQLVNSWEKPGIKLKCCGRIVHGSCKVQLTDKPTCEFCEYQDREWSEDEVREENTVCFGRWHCNNKYLIQIDGITGWISEKQIIDLDCGDIGFIWLSNSTKEQYDE